ncbi:hypothetical protein J2W49_002054 [Hydrogenophaga palleronii]|uniref:Uncharacterized protein n=1 Tax=Hydrogenophaga palleronii TaxID=65655 RepID=A0ABU1WLC3_9BURK|nr:hypothetical protein [Hydrogenophaga palleronii]
MRLAGYTDDSLRVQMCCAAARIKGCASASWSSSSESDFRLVDRLDPQPMRHAFIPSRLASLCRLLGSISSSRAAPAH